LLIGLIEKKSEMDAIGEKIRIKRLIKNFSQEYMAFMLEISQAAYSNIESDKTELTIKRAYEIAEILEMSPFELMPKPKFSTGINHLLFLRTLKKVSNLWISAIRKKKTTAPEY
jgi:transcriptional regulator with XRE-family HTH domain